MLAKFTTETTARNFSQRTIKASAVVLGDDDRYWVVTLAKFAELERQGFEAI
jgi:hypothetical protein